MQGVTRARNCTISDDGNLKASKCDSKTWNGNLKLVSKIELSPVPKGSIGRFSYARLLQDVVKVALPKLYPRLRETLLRLQLPSRN